MNAQKYTKKSLEAVNEAQNIAIANQNMNIEQPHLLLALMKQENGLIPQLITKMSISAEQFRNAVENTVNGISRVTGSGRKPDTIYLSNEVDRAMVSAEDIAKNMGDEYVSVEHIMLAFLDNPDSLTEKLFKQFNIEKNAFLSVLASVRGSAKVTSQEPEETYDVLVKYGQDLTELAKNNKLDPVIGRDSEIRNIVRILSRKTKNNPVVIGEPGVGKTAIAE